MRDPGGLLSVAAVARPRVARVMPRPADLTPADTSSIIAPGLAAALRRDHPDVDEIVVEQRPDADAIAAVRDRAARGRRSSSSARSTATASPSSWRSSRPWPRPATPTIAVAMRGPWDAARYPAGVTALATYSILPPSLTALADVLAGRASATGRLPVTMAT